MSAPKASSSTYQLVIVEDEAEIRDGLANVVSWESVGFSVAAALRNGREALQYLRHQDADVVISDIVMPQGTGLELARWLHQNKPMTHVVILSGFESFRYAQEAMRYGVEHYLLKPTNIDELYAIFRQLREEIDAAERTRRHELSQAGSGSRLLLLYQQILFSRLLSEGTVDLRFLRPLFELAGLDPDMATDPCCSCLLRLRGSAPPAPASTRFGDLDQIGAISHLLREGPRGVFAALIPLDELKLIALLWPENWEPDAQVPPDLEAAASARLSSCRRLLGLDIVLEDFRAHEGLSSFLSYATAAGLQKPSHVLEKLKATLGFPVDGPLNLSATGALEDPSGLERIFERCAGESQELRLLKLCVLSFALELRRRCRETGGECPPLLGDDARLGEVIGAEDAAVMYDYCAELAREHSNPAVARESITIARMKEYIESHACEDIGVKDIARHVSLNPAYASRLFKAQSGESITHCVQREKVCRAKQYLRDPRYRVYHVGEMVGYRDIRHFYKVFRRVSGMTPQQFRRTGGV